jgi:hypothetical protein
MSFWQNFTNWLGKPFSIDMDAFHWFLFWGLLIVIAIAWGFVLRHVYGGVERAI